MSNKRFKLTYFDVEGRAEPIRLLFALANVSYEDDRIELTEWPKIKFVCSVGFDKVEKCFKQLKQQVAKVKNHSGEFPTEIFPTDNSQNKTQVEVQAKMNNIFKGMPWGQVPILRDGDLTICQSNVIIKYLARKFNYAGQNEAECVKCEEYVDCMSDLMEVCTSFIVEKDPVRKAELANKMFDESFPFYFTRFNDILKNNGKFLVGQSITFADLHIAHYLQLILSKMPTVLDNYPALKSHQETVFNYPGIKEWISRRPPSIR